MNRWLLFMGCWLLGGAYAAEVAPLRHEQLGVSIKALDYPENLRKDLRSGLTNRLLIRVTLLAGSKPVSEKVVDIAVKYDLWDEKFAASTVSGAGTVATHYSSIEEALAMLADLKLPNLFAASEYQSGSVHTLRVDALLNPIDKERMEKIRKWVSDNSSYTPAGETTRGPSSSTSTSANALFNRIFEQYAVGGELAAAWRETASSQPFIPEALRQTQ